MSRRNQAGGWKTFHPQNPWTSFTPHDPNAIQPKLHRKRHHGKKRKSVHPQPLPDNDLIPLQNVCNSLEFNLLTHNGGRHIQIKNYTGAILCEWWRPKAGNPRGRYVERQQYQHTPHTYFNLPELIQYLSSGTHDGNAVVPRQASPAIVRGDAEALATVVAHDGTTAAPRYTEVVDSTGSQVSPNHSAEALHACC